jgi:hypothetical protein
MMEEEFASTGAVEMSVFHALLLGNGTKPLRLPPIPTLMPLQTEGVVLVTVNVAVPVAEPALFVAVNV